MAHNVGSPVLRSIVLLLLSGVLLSSAQARVIPRNSLYGAIAYHDASSSSGFAVDRRNSREARVEALRQCGHPKCEVALSLRNECGAIARGGKLVRSQKGATRQEAEAKALRLCGERCEVIAWACTR